MKDRHSIRLEGYDYSRIGAYFVTVCAWRREWLFQTDAVQTIVQKTWDQLPDRFLNIKLDEFVIMPNHIHGILWIHSAVGAQFIAPIKDDNTTNKGVIVTKGVINHAPTLGMVVRYFKARSCYRIHRLDPSVAVWQRNYYEHIIRDEPELNRIRQYVRDNPKNWNQDPENVGAQFIAPIRDGTKMAPTDEFYSNIDKWEPIN
ncbi:MAG: transposase [Deltaproteobacteria bacterium]|nr:transposase [Deltaproteobacteria bacterium]